MAEIIFRIASCLSMILIFSSSAMSGQMEGLQEQILSTKREKAQLVLDSQEFRNKAHELKIDPKKLEDFENKIIKKNWDIFNLQKNLTLLKLQNFNSTRINNEIAAKKLEAKIEELEAENKKLESDFRSIKNGDVESNKRSVIKQRFVKNKDQIIDAKSRYKNFSYAKQELKDKINSELTVFRAATVEVSEKVYEAWKPKLDNLVQALNTDLNAYQALIVSTFKN